MKFMGSFDKLLAMTKRKRAGSKEKRNDYIRFLGVASTVGINFVTSTFVGFAIGYWIIDPILNTKPWFTLIFMFLGIAAAFKYLFKLVKRAENFNEEEELNSVEKTQKDSKRK